MVMMGYTLAEMADLLREYSHMGLSPDESLALAEHIDLLVQADAVVPPMSPRCVAEWRTYSTLAEAAEAAGFTFDQGLTAEQREKIGGDYLIADDQWSVVNVGDGSSYLMRRVGDSRCGLLRVTGYEGGGPMKLTRTWRTIAVVGYDGAVSRYQDLRAHGGVCLLQARTGKYGALGRKVNTTGRHYEISEVFGLTAETLAQWRSVGNSR